MRRAEAAFRPVTARSLHRRRESLQSDGCDRLLNSPAREALRRRRHEGGQGRAAVGKSIARRFCPASSCNRYSFAGCAVHHLRNNRRLQICHSYTRNARRTVRPPVHVWRPMMPALLREPEVSMKGVVEVQQICQPAKVLCFLVIFLILLLPPMLT